MEINEINKELYELAFIQNGEYGYHENNWKPSINEREIETYCQGEDGRYVPATPLGYRDYKESRIQGIKNILDQYPCVDLTDDKHLQIKKGDNTVRLYDKIKVDNERYFVVCGYDEYKYFVVDDSNNVYSIEFEKEKENADN